MYIRLVGLLGLGSSSSFGGSVLVVGTSVETQEEKEEGNVGEDDQQHRVGPSNAWSSVNVLDGNPENQDRRVEPKLDHLDLSEVSLPWCLVSECASEVVEVHQGVDERVRGDTHPLEGGVSTMG